MKTNYLLPYKYKFLGWILFTSGILGGIFLMLNGYESDFLTLKVLSLFDSSFGIGLKEPQNHIFKIIDNSITDELVSVLIIMGGLFVGFSKEKVEDEFTYKLRKDSLVWSMIFNYSILLLAILLVYDLTFFHILVFNMFTPLIFFIVRFNYLKFKANSHEE
ncbi:hypothetical protein [Mangrovimonas aestuarii]|uniref:hypothetical protein n=1 Tax=Mangrovimonas aestuarii TaxID=3018443 RepID=UPI002377FD85|nr:hypothetical protein [Mangrovimonas aestuarii]